MKDSVNISYFGQSFFKIFDKNKILYIDPYKAIGGLSVPSLKDKVDVLLISHEHDDHNNRNFASDNTYVISHPGEYDSTNILVRGVLSFHDNVNGKDRGENVMYSFNFNDVNFVHLGDLGEKELSNEQIDDLGVVNVLFVPVGGHFTIDAKDAVNVINQLNPNIIIPMHYKTEKLELPLAPVSDFLNEFGGAHEEVDSLKVDANMFQDEDFETRVVVLKNIR